MIVFGNKLIVKMSVLGNSFGSYCMRSVYKISGNHQLLTFAHSYDLLCASYTLNKCPTKQENIFPLRKGNMNFN